MTDGLAGASTLAARLPERQGFGDATLIRLGEGSIDLGGGNPDTDLLPTDLYRDAMREAMSAPEFPAALRYSPSPGIPALRTAIAAREGVDAQRIIVDNGGAHGLSLAALATLDPGDTILVDDPVYPLFLRVLDLVGVTIVPVPVQADGLDVTKLEDLLRGGLRPRALFTVPTFHNPMGATLSAQKSAALVDLAERYGFMIIADDPYREIAFPGEAVPDRPRLRDTDRVVAVNTFSKTLGPGLRLGWLVVPQSLSAAYTKLRNRLDGQTSGVLQEIARRMLADERYDASIAAAGAGYAAKARVLHETLRDEFGEDVSLEAPRGGFFVWARLAGDAGVDFAKLFESAQDLGVTYQRGEWFAAGGVAAGGEAAGGADFRGYVRLSFSEPTIDDLREGTARLARAWRAEHRD